jgi:ectoine hydroxylase-related dioxygenase (phytanoyl-CoA dioxygenase family)
VTSQVNVVNPGGAAQDMHRDYHLGFASGEQVARFPVHAHRLSAVLTLQGAVAHTDMPVETGPTMYLPHSQKYLPGYLAWRMPEFGEYFAASYVQLPLCKGDAVFFNPALFHVIAACAEGYPFPSNLDLDQPVDGLAPRTQADILGRAVSEQWSRQQLETELGTWSARRQTRRYTYSTKEIP